MKKNIKLFFIVGLIFTYTNFFAFEKIVFEEKNEFNGLTEKYIFHPSDEQFQQCQNVVASYDDDNKLRKISYFLSSELQKQTGFQCQEEFYENDVLVEYKCIFSDEEFAKKGIKYRIEKVDNKDNPYMYGLSDGSHSVFFPADFFVSQYPCYNLKYLSALFFRDEGAKGNRYVFSKKLSKGASFVTVSSEIEKLTKHDIDNIQKISTFFGNEQIAEIYNCKVRVVSAGKEYTAYIQKNFARGISKNMFCLLAYCTMGLNENLYLFATAFIEAEKK